MEERRIRIGSLIEWMTAVIGVVVVLWIMSVPIQRFLGPRLHAAIAEADLAQDTPPGVPAGATNVPVMLLLDGREIREGDLHTKLEGLLPAKYADGPPHVSHAAFGDRQTRAYVVNGAKFYVVCEHTEPNGPMKIVGIYVP